jgi:hypothetical protein
MSYRCIKFSTNAAGGGDDLLPLAQRINNWLALNEFVTVVDMTVSWKDSQRQGAGANVHLFFRQGGVRQYAQRFQTIPGYRAQEQVAEFFLANPQFTLILAREIVSPYAQPAREDLVIIYQANVDLIRAARPGVYPNYAPAGGDLAPGTYGTFTNIVDPTAPEVEAANTGINIWREGAPGILIRNVDSAPDLQKQSWPIGGLGLECHQADANPDNPDSKYADCGCQDAPFFDAVNTSVTPPVPSTTVPVTPPYP